MHIQTLHWAYCMSGIDFVPEPFPEDDREPAVDFEYSSRTREFIQRVDGFMQENVYPVEAEREEFVQNPANRWVVPPMMEGLKAKARAAGLWNLFMPHEYGKFSPGLTNLEYAPLAEL